MDVEEFRRLRVLFDRLAELPPQERWAGLDREATLGEATRRHLRALLDADVALEGMTARPALAGKSPLQDSPRWIGCRIGAYAIESELGHGGMGSVFLAHRADGSVEQKVAVKLIRPEQLDEHTLARFRLERQVMALLEHPNIAALHDLGELDDGTPYVVMEYVEGQPITDFAHARHLDLKQRLRLFIDVCDAVSYAHRSMVVHRDLKPSNILVTAEGRPKLLDFGIAKPLLARFGTQEIQETGAAQRFFSPHNAAPEQLRGEPITVACDVYGLGILLYELLAEAAPFDFTGKTPGQIEQLIFDTEPLAPSARASADARNLRGDLDAIVLHALRKNPERRYATVDHFSGDIRRYLEGRPVEARKGRTWYRVRKFVGRHRVALGATAVFLALLGAGGFALWMQALEVIRQRDRAVQATNFMVETFRAADPEKALGEKITAKQILDQAQRSLTVDTSITPQLRAELLGKIAEVKIHLSAAKDALPLIAQALLDLDRDENANTEIRSALLELEARAAISDDQYDLAKTAIAEATALHPGVRLRALIEQDTITLLFQQGATDELRPHIDRALRELAPKLAPDDPVRWELLSGIAATEEVVAGVEQATQLLEDLLRNEGSDAQDRPYVLKAKYTLAGLYDDAHRTKEAKALTESLRQPIERLYSHDSVEFASWENQLANVLDGDNQHAQALSLYENALAIYTELLGPESRNVVKMKFNIAGAAEALGQWEQAEKNYLESIKLAIKVLPDTNQNVEMFRMAYALLLNKRHRFGEAEPLFKLVLSRADRDPNFRDDDVFKAARFGLAIAEYAVAPTKEHLHAFELVSTPPADAGFEIKQITREQMEVMKFLGLPLPAMEQPASSPPKTQ
jgi:tRNA A-37 threonylcarbamoyl transferase component Bud32/tetratricopeptide (TPR) repeat protein